MNHTEAGTTANNPAEKFRGREALDVEQVMKVQLGFMHSMAPERLHAYFGLNKDGSAPLGIEDALYWRWIEKYAVLFKDYCDLHADNTELIERLKAGALTPDDRAKIEKYLADPLHADAAAGIGGHFFTSDAEVDELVQSVMH